MSGWASPDLGEGHRSGCEAVEGTQPSVSGLNCLLRPLALDCVPPTSKTVVICLIARHITFAGAAVAPPAPRRRICRAQNDRQPLGQRIGGRGPNPRRALYPRPRGPLLHVRSAPHRASPAGRAHGIAAEHRGRPRRTESAPRYPGFGQAGPRPLGPLPRPRSEFLFDYITVGDKIYFMDL